jgi:hypothetical protein
MAEQTSELYAAVVALEESPGELGVWLALGEALETIGEGAAASRCVGALGAAASELGQVGLAVACARWLDSAEGPEAAAALVDAIGATHCHGSDRIDRSSRPRPPAPPLPGEAAGPAPTSRAEALARAESAWTAAREAAAARAPARLPPTPLIHVLEAADFARLVAVMRLRRHRAGELVIDVGQPARAL